MLTHLARCPAASARHCRPLMAVRHLSKKTDHLEQQDLSAISKRPKSPPKYVLVDQLPKPPQDQSAMLLEQLYAKVYMRDLPQRPPPANAFHYQFEIPRHFVRPGKGGKHSKPFEPASNILDDLDRDPHGYQFEHAPEHPLRRLITGMFAFNGAMDSIDNDYLWEMYPQGQMFGSVPFGGDVLFDGFRKWEEGESAKVAEKHERVESKAREARELKEHIASQRAPKRGGRRKMSREVLKEYRKLKEDEKKK